MITELPISLCMIVRNEEAFLDTSLKSVKTVLALEDIIVVDTGSADATKDIAFSHGAKVCDFKWCDDFSAARNFSAEKARHEWILTIDADELILDADIPKLESFLLHAKPQSVGAIRIIALPGDASSYLSRLYNRKRHKWVGNIHEQLVSIDTQPNEILYLPVAIEHYGYLPDVKSSKGKFERNLRMLEDALSKQSEDPYILAQLGKCYYVNGKDLVKACEYFERALSANEDHRLEYIYITVEFYGYALINTGQYEKALEHISRYEAYYMTKPEFRYLAAHVYQNNGMLQEAVESYESCIGANTVSSEGITSYLSYYNIGVILECVGMIEDAAAMYRNCGDYEPALGRLKELKGQLKGVDNGF